MTRVTLRDVALEAGVSHQTVSNVLNNHPFIRPATRERVLSAIQALDYHPNQAAKALRESRVTTLCCAFFGHDAEDISDPYRNLVQSAFVAEANARGYTMTTAFVNAGQTDSLQSLRQRYMQRQFGGAVIVGNTLDAGQWQTLDTWGLPTVLFDHALPGTAARFISADYHGGMARLVAHHVQQGRRRLALIIPDRDPSSTAVARVQGFLAAAQAQGAAAQVISGDWSYESGERALRTLWSQPQRPDAVLAGNDRMGAGALRAAHELGLRVPSELAISGFDDFEFARFTTPSLTTVQIPHGQMARQAVQHLIAGLEGRALPPPVAAQLPLVVRESG
jgi:LacI family transcriptional regulator